MTGVLLGIIAWTALSVPVALLAGRWLAGCRRDEPENGPAADRVNAIAEKAARWVAASGPCTDPDLPRGLVGQPRAVVFGYLGLPMPDLLTQDVELHDRVGNPSAVLPTLLRLTHAVDAAWAEDDEGTRAELVQLGAHVVRWIQAIDARTVARAAVRS